MMDKMLALADAQQRILAMAPQMPMEMVGIGDAIGRFLAQPLQARRTQPSHDLSAMDGYAICGAGPWRLIGESRAGAPFAGKLNAGECTRISTGADVPSGADRILIQENAQISGNQVISTQDMPSAGKHMRREGMDFCEGAEILPAGAQLGAAQIALAVAAGHGQVPTYRSPTIAIIDSGDELSGDPENCGPNQIPASNGAMIAAMLHPLACQVRRIGPVPDDRAALANALRQAEGADILVTSGGASVGDHDLIRPALEAWGANLDFWKVAMKPGKPLMLAQRGKQTIIGLPGNPVSSYVTAALFLLPLVRKAMGSATPLPQQFKAQTACDLPASGTRHEFLRATWQGGLAQLVDSQDSSALRALAQSNCLIDRPPHSPALKAGEMVPMILP